jgi:hypothetical protein
MHIGATSHPISPLVRPPPLPAVKARPQVPRRASPARSSDAATEHDATLLVAALEEVQARRAALEWLLEADLLSACLV